MYVFFYFLTLLFFQNFYSFLCSLELFCLILNYFGSLNIMNDKHCIHEYWE